LSYKGTLQLKEKRFRISVEAYRPSTSYGTFFLYDIG